MLADYGNSEEPQEGEDQRSKKKNRKLLAKMAKSLELKKITHLGDSFRRHPSMHKGESKSPHPSLLKAESKSHLLWSAEHTDAEGGGDYLSLHTPSPPFSFIPAWKKSFSPLCCTPF